MVSGKGSLRVLQGVQVEVYRGGKSADPQEKLTFNGQAVHCGPYKIKVGDMQHAAEAKKAGVPFWDIASGGLRFSIFVTRNPEKEKEARAFVQEVNKARLGIGATGGGGVSAAYRPVNAIGFTSPISRASSNFGRGMSIGSKLMAPLQPKTVTGKPANRDLASSSSSKSPYFPASSSASSSLKPNSSATTTNGGCTKSKSSVLDQVFADGKDLMEVADADFDMALFPPTPGKGSGTRQPLSPQFSDDQPSKQLITMGPPPPTTQPSKTYGKKSSLVMKGGGCTMLTLSSTSSSSSSASSSSLTVGGKRAGLTNLGNTCYLNSVVQAIAAVMGFSDDLLSNFWVKQTLQDLRTSTERQRRLKVYGSFTHLLLTLRQNQAGGGSVTNPSTFRRAMAAYFSAYGGNRQQDAHEFMGNLLNTLQEELCFYGRRFATQQLHAAKQATATVSQTTKADGEGPDQKKAKRVVEAISTKGRKGGGAPHAQEQQQTKLSSFFKPRTSSLTADRGNGALVSSSSTNGQLASGTLEEQQGGEEEEDTVISKEEAAILERVLPVTRHFHAEVEKTLTCVGVDCAYSRSYLESYTDFSVDLVGDGEVEVVDDEGGNPMQMFDLLAHCFQDQELELACDQCRAQNKVRVSYRIRKLPHVLIVHLKRFRITGGLGMLGASSSKLQSRVMAPSTLDLAQFCDAQTANPRDVSTGLEGPAGSELTKQLLECQAASPSSPPRRVSSSFSVGSGFGKASGTTTPSSLTQQGNISGVERVRLQLQKKQAAALNKKEGEEDRWSALDEKKEEEKRSEATISLGLKGEEDDSTTLIDLVGDVMATSEEEPVDEELQEAIRLSLMESRAGAATLLPPSPPPASLVSTARAEDKENRRPPPIQTQQQQQQQQAKATSAPPLDLRNITTRTSTGSFPASPSNASTAVDRGGELRSSYELQTVLRHLGRSANSGHYITDVRRKVRGSLGGEDKVEWTRYDDSLVSPLAQGDQILQDDRSLRTGYIFVYQAQRD